MRGAPKRSLKNRAPIAAPTMIDVIPGSYSVSMSRSKLGKVTITPGEPAAIYCRISHAREEDQTGVDRQERICREIAERLQLPVEPTRIYVDNNRSAWQRNRKRPGWEEILKAMGDGEIRHVIVYHPDCLMRQPKDLEELLAVADDKRVLLHGEANRRDLSDPDDRFILRIKGAPTARRVARPPRPGVRRDRRSRPVARRPTPQHPKAVEASNSRSEQGPTGLGVAALRDFRQPPWDGPRRTGGPSGTYAGRTSACPIRRASVGPPVHSPHGSSRPKSLRPATCPPAAPTSEADPHAAPPSPPARASRS